MTTTLTPTVLPITLTVEAPLVHGGGQDGSNTQLFRRQTRLHDGTVCRVPVVSGNALRGILRRQGAWALWEALGEPTLTPAQARALASGGALRTEKAIPLDVLRDVRDWVDHLGLFGAAWGGTIHDGALMVGHLVPQCVENGTGQIRAARLVDRVMLTRHDTDLIPTETVEGGTDESNQMIYEVEALAPGVTLDGWINFRPWATDHHRDWAALCWQRWVATGAHIGGKSAAGHGRIAVSSAPDGLDAAAAQRALDRVTANRGEILAALEGVH